MLKLNPKERPDIFSILDTIDTISSLSDDGGDSNSSSSFEIHNVNNNLKPEYSSTDSDVFGDWLETPHEYELLESFPCLPPLTQL